MTETMQMINIINTNKKNKQILINKQLKKAKRNKLLSKLFLQLSIIIFTAGVVYFAATLNYILNN